LPMSDEAPYLPRVGREVAVARLRAIIDAVEPEAEPVDDGALAVVCGRLLAGADNRVLWLFLAVIHARFPEVVDIERAQRTIRLDGAAVLVRRELSVLAAAAVAGVEAARVPVEVLTDHVVVDVHHTASAEYVSGIQRVVREVAARWRTAYEPTFIAWAGGYRAMRLLTGEESENLFGEPASALDVGVTLVPWGGTYLLPELAAEPARSSRLLGLARYSGVRVAAIGYDCIPITSAETAWSGMSSFFLGYLAFMRYAERLAPISAASAAEFRGWRRMIGAAGFAGPEIDPILLPVHPRMPTADDVAAAKDRFDIPRHPLVLVVGSHEPRKNHLAVLHAAELLWRAGLQFSLAFVGTGSWGAERFEARLAELIAEGRPVEIVTGLSDAVLWAAYGLARCVVFPSFNEGFGLPVAEALAAGTPVLTSDFGSMREIGAPDGTALGVILVDPRDDHAIADGLCRLVSDQPDYDRLQAEARSRARRTWDEYAAATWTYLVDPLAPVSDL
jgi:hypothetical protein